MSIPSFTLVGKYFLILFSNLRHQNNNFLINFNRSLLSYFTDTIPFQIVIHGGNYSLIAIGVLIFMLWAFKGLRIIILSVFMAMFGVSMLIIIYEIAGDLELVADV